MVGALRLVAAAVWAGLLVGTPGVVAWGDQTDPRLEGLFARLAATQELTEAHSVEQQIWAIWIESGDPEVEKLMRQGIADMRQRRLDAALSSFDRMVEHAPAFAEGWNKRATVHYMRGDYPASVRDIQRTLALEPRHFGALSGLGLIYDALDEPAAALRSYEAVLALHPNSRSTQLRVQQLQRELGGRRS